MKYSEHIAALEQSEQVAIAAYDTAISTGMSAATVKKYKVRWDDARSARRQAEGQVRGPLENLIIRAEGRIARELEEAQEIITEFHAVVAKSGLTYALTHYGNSTVRAEAVAELFTDFQRDLAAMQQRFPDYPTAWAGAYDYQFRAQLRRLREGYDWEPNSSSPFTNAVGVCKAQAASWFLNVIERINDDITAWQQKPNPDDEMPGVPL